MMDSWVFTFFYCEIIPIGSKYIRHVTKNMEKTEIIRDLVYTSDIGLLLYEGEIIL